MLSVTEAAETIGVHRSTVIAMLKDGRLDGRIGQPGTRPRYEVRAEAAEGLRDAGRERAYDNQRVPQAPQAPSAARAAQARERPRSGVWARAAQDDLAARVQMLEAENRRLRLVAQRANSALTLQTEALQQYLVDDTVPQ